MRKYFSLVALVIIDLILLITIPFFISKPDDLSFLFGILLIVLVVPINYLTGKWMFK